MTNLRERQLTFALCCRMPLRLVAQELELSLATVRKNCTSLITNRGMADSIEFALQQNAAVREKLYQPL